MRTVLELDGLFDGTTATSDAAIVIEDGELTWVANVRGYRRRRKESFQKESMRVAHEARHVDGSERN